VVRFQDRNGEHFYHNLLICLKPDFPLWEHPAVVFIDFFSEVVGDPALPVCTFELYFVDLSAPKKNDGEHLPV
jgi:hypothetical protein